MQREDGASVEVHLLNGGVALVDRDSAPELAGFSWRRTSHRNGYVYAYRRDGRKIILMHRHIMQPGIRLVVDHINHDGLDNRRANLRICTHAQNVCNSRLPSNNTTGFKGVSRCKNRFRAVISFHDRNLHIGLFKTAQDAANAYDRMAISLYGEFAMTNSQMRCS